MRTLSRITVIIAGIIFTLSYTVVAWAEGQEAKKIVAARVNGTPVTLESVNDMTKRLSPQNGRGAGPAQKDAARKAALDRLILEELAYQKAKAEGIKAEPAEIDKMIEDFRARLGGTEALGKALEREGMTEGGLRTNIEKGIVLQRIFAKEVFDKIVISDDDIQKEYEKEKANFVKPEQMIITDTVFFLDPDDKGSLEKAETILKKILDDTERSPWNLVSDGTFMVYDAEIKKEDQGELYKEARKLSIGELSGVIKTTDSLHIIKVKAYSPEKQYTLEQVKGYLKEKLVTEARQESLARWGTELRKDAKVEMIEK